MEKVLGMTVIAAIIALMTSFMSPPHLHANGFAKADIASSTPAVSPPNELKADSNSETAHAECHLAAILPAKDASGAGLPGGTSDAAHGSLANTTDLDLNLPPPRA